MYGNPHIYFDVLLNATSAKIRFGFEAKKNCAGQCSIKLKTRSWRKHMATGFGVKPIAKFRIQPNVVAMRYNGIPRDIHGIV